MAVQTGTAEDSWSPRACWARWRTPKRPKSSRELELHLPLDAAVGASRATSWLGMGVSRMVRAAAGLRERFLVRPAIHLVPSLPAAAFSRWDEILEVKPGYDTMEVTEDSRKEMFMRVMDAR